MVNILVTCLSHMCDQKVVNLLTNLSQPGYLDSSESSRSSTATHSRTSSEGVTPPYAVLPNTANNPRGQNQVKLEPSGGGSSSDQLQQLASVWRNKSSEAKTIFTSIPQSSAILWQTQWPIICGPCRPKTRFCWRKAFLKSGGVVKIWSQLGTCSVYSGQSQRRHMIRVFCFQYNFKH